MKIKQYTLRLSRLQLAYVLLAALTIGTIVLRCISLALFFDEDVGYFQNTTNALLKLYILEGVVSLGCIALPFLIKKESLPTEERPLSMAGLVGAGLTALVLVITAFYFLIRRKALPSPDVLLVIAALFLVLGAGYFATQFREKPDATTSLLLGYGLILSSALLLAVTYFDLYTQMNAPHKVSIHAALLTVMVAMLFELRSFLGKPYPHVRAAICGFAFFVTATVGVSNTVAFLLGIFDNALYLLCDLFCIAIAVYFAAKCFDLCRPMHAQESEDET